MAKQSDKMLNDAAPMPWWLKCQLWYFKRRLGVEMIPGQAGMRIMVYKVVRFTDIEVLKRRYSVLRDRVVVIHIDDIKGHILKQRKGKVSFTKKGHDMLVKNGYKPNELLDLWQHGKRQVKAEKVNRKRGRR